MSDRERMRQSIIRRFAERKRETRQLIIDVQSWNENRTDAPPEDCEAEQVFLAVLVGLPEDPTTWTREEKHRWTKAIDAYGVAIELTREHQ